MGDMQLFQTAGDVSYGSVPQEVRALAGALAAKHGLIRVASEASGTHLYMACPDCLEREGSRELDSMHLSLNADRYLSSGSWKRSRGTYNADNSAMCMKTGKPFTVSDLLGMAPLGERGYKESVPKVVESKNKHRLVDDGNGNMVPENPGHVIPLPVLPETHPAIEFVRGRGYDPLRLWEQFRCSFCTRELPEDASRHRFYRRLPGGFRDTPQGRIVFYADMFGVQRGWQARILEKVSAENTEKYFWHPYENRWDMVFWRSEPEDEWTLHPRFRDAVYEWKPSKYMTAPGTQRNKLLMGLDAALKWNREAGRDYDRSLCGMVEGPLDAARFGPPFMPLLGKYLSPPQAETALKYFKSIRYMADNDKAGRKSREKVEGLLSSKCDFGFLEMEGFGEGMDPGDLTDSQAAALWAPHVEETANG